MKQEDYLSSLGKKKLFRVMAWICLIILFALIVITFITGVTGSKYFMPCLVVTIIVPFLMYVFLWTGKVLAGIAENRENKDKLKSDKETKEDNK